MSTNVKLAPPIVENKLAAHAKNTPQSIVIPFLMNKAVGWSQFWGLSLIVKTVQSSTEIVKNWKCRKDTLIFKDGKYQAIFNGAGDNLFSVGQTYKVQIAYIAAKDDGSEGSIGHYSNVSTFKVTETPSLYIEGLKDDINVHTYHYTGVYTNQDQSERVYSYRFDLYNDSGMQVATSGELLHNSSKDTSITTSSDTWTTRYALENEKNYTIVYKVKTVNGLEAASQAYRIYNGITFDSNIVSYCNFMANINQDEAYVDLSIQPNPSNTQEKYISGQFILLRSSSEDGYKTWHEVTTFFLSSHNVLTPLFICKDYCVSQGVTYKYALQAHNNQGVYSNRWPSKPETVFVDFEDMFLSDGERQLKIQFNPKVASFKNTLLEVKMDTLGGKYPFFFRNGNVNYKEFPISGLISMQMDKEETFMKGIQITGGKRATTPATEANIVDLPTQLTGDNIRKEREFKMEVLSWLTNGKPKLFRSPTEGSYIVRLMNTSLSPNEDLGRMLHTFSCTAYEIDDFTFENLRKYNMMVESYVEKRDLEFKVISLRDNQYYNGVASGLSACIATIHTRPYTVFRYQLKNDQEGWNQIQVGATGIYTFPSEVLAENELMTIAPPEAEESYGRFYWEPGTVLNYSTYKEVGLMNFSHIESVEVSDCIKTYIGDNSPVINKIVDPYKIRKTLGNIYYLKVSARPIIPIDNIKFENGEYQFFIDTIPYDPSPEEILRHDVSKTEINYYDGKTHQYIGPRANLNCEFELRENLGTIDMSGTITKDSDALGAALGIDSETSDPIRNVNGRLILTNLSGVDSLDLGQGLYIDIAYQEVTRTYTVENMVGSEVHRLKQIWLNDIENQGKYQAYYDQLVDWCRKVGEDMIIDAI